MMGWRVRPPTIEPSNRSTKGPPAGGVSPLVDRFEGTMGFSEDVNAALRQTRLRRLLGRIPIVARPNNGPPFSVCRGCGSKECWVRELEVLANVLESRRI